MSDKLKIHFILEGNEEETLFKLIEKYGVNGVFDMSYYNAKGGSKLPACFHYSYMSDKYDIVFCVYDVDYEPNNNTKTYSIIRKKLEEVLGKKSSVNNISLCTNPNILLILLLGFDKLENLKSISASKSENTTLINKYVEKIGNKKKYDASDWQLDLILKELLYDESKYKNILDNYGVIDTDYTKQTIGSNILNVLKALHDGDVDFFTNIMKEDN